MVAATAVRFAFHHSGTGRELVHRLKYQGLAGAADVLAAAMAPLVAAEAEVIVPLPRAPLRRAFYGVDSARELARRIGRLTGLPVVAALGAPLWWPRHAGRQGSVRSAPQFYRRRLIPAPVVLIDDVVTSGATFQGAVAAMPEHISSVVTATSPGMIDSSKAPIASGRLRDGTAEWQRQVDKRP